ncbi:glycosyltransferase involved in cell wall biosynthesis [Anoxybacillus mongoliensis]|uniref:Glycosyltransferase involved in cell wall biosynthesis n=1 Tax=Anoxybacillus mongoliensis TaxID=452565 RepID=A0A7W8JFK4_9BACL|nr:glycosyltransferase [Anoxybacillus mongoliensis]MBB5356075.1 glycosyltransferase involved in cell wall biosynthesis [Anoxybacillus mongoliensis]
MRVLFQTRFNVFDRKGGDTVQLLKTKEYIEKLFPDIQIDIITGPNVDLSKYDLVHVFNLLRPQETILFIQNAKRQNKKVALSTIYWKSEEFEKKGQIGLRKIVNNLLGYESIEKLRALFRYYFDGEKHEGTLKVIKEGFQNLQKYIVEHSDILLPNGIGEIYLLKKELKLDKIPNYVVVPNAIDKNIFFSNNDSNKINTERNLILCVGRIEPRKNQLNLVKAMQGLPYELYLIGKVHSTQKGYFKKIKRYVSKSSNVKIIDELDQNELSTFYRRAKVHVLPSWYDTPGLVSLEAAVNGCNIVVTDRGTTKEYFGDYAFYCEPNDVQSIRNAIIKAFQSEYNENLKKRILEEYTWENTAMKTVEAYRKILN